MLVLLQKKVIRVIQYFCCMVLRAQGQSSGGRIRAVAANSGPVILPRMGIVPYALVFSRVAAGHHIELAVFLAKPDRGRDGCAVLAKTDQGDVLLIVNLGRNRHGVIVPTDDPISALSSAGGLGSLGATSIAREYPVVLKARDAQMDARSSQAQKTRGGQR